MAKDQKQPVEAGIMGSDDGYLYVRALEDKSLDNYLSVYMARIDGYRVQPADWGTKVTMKIVFPAGTSNGNANLWGFFIAQAAHKIGKKPYIDIKQVAEGVAAYVSFNLYASVKYLESKSQDRNNF